MIDRHVFVREFAMLLDRFGREMSAPGIDRYRTFLNAQLTTSEFEAAARIIFEEDQWFPSPRRFVDAARGNAKELAESEWDNLLQQTRDAHFHDSTPPRLTEAGRAALKAAGGWSAVARAESDYSLNKTRNTFIAAYQDATTGPSRPQLDKSAPTVLEGAL